MTSQEKKEYLQQYRVAEQEEERLSGEIERWRSRAEKMTTGYGLSPSGGGDGRSLEHTVERIDELIRQLVGQLDELVALRQEIGAVIDAVQDTRLRELLRLRYIDGMSLAQIADKMNYCYKQTIRLHLRALAMLSLNVQQKQFIV